MNANETGIVMLDVLGTELTDEDIRRIKHPLTGGVILFSRNYRNRKQLTKLTDAIHSLRPSILIAVDHEGGRVQRFRDGFTRIPAMRALGELWEKDVLLATKTATAVGYVLAAELRACGVDLSFTPVLDLDYGVSSVIGNRAFHRDSRVVSMLAQSVNHGLALAGMANCGKHFPGHGYVKADSHTDIPVDKRALKTILKEDARPYSDLGISLSAVMPAHVVYPKFDEMPAGFSKKWLTLLRKDLGFDGVIFSDDLSMEGARVVGDVVQGARCALSAGCDMILICNSPEQADKLLENLKVSDVKLRGSRKRIASLLSQKKATTWNDLQKDARYKEAVEWICGL